MQNDMEGKPQSAPGICPLCGEARACAMETGMHPCWCARMPVLLNVDPQLARCVCARCLQQLLARQGDQPAA